LTLETKSSFKAIIPTAELWGIRKNKINEKEFETVPLRYSYPKKVIDTKKTSKEEKERISMSTKINKEFYNELGRQIDELYKKEHKTIKK
jgi:hypothetical protein